MKTTKRIELLATCVFFLLQFCIPESKMTEEMRDATYEELAAIIADYDPFASRGIPEEDAILTDQGIKTFPEAFAILENNSPIRISSQVEKVQVSFPVTLTNLIAPDGPHEIIELTSGPRSVGGRARGNGVSLRLGTGSSLKVRIGETKESGAWEGYPEEPQGEGKTAAQVLISGATNQTMRAELSAVFGKPKLPNAGATMLPFISELGLNTRIKLNAFLRLFGFFLGDGSMKDNFVRFELMKRAKSAFLRKIFKDLEIPVFEEDDRGEQGQGVFIYPEPAVSANNNERWETPRLHYLYQSEFVKFFAENFGHCFAAPAGRAAVIEKCRREGTKLPSFKAKTVTSPPDAFFPIADFKLPKSQKNDAARATRNRPNNQGVKQRRCHNPHCSVLPKWQKLDKDHFRETKTGFEGECKICAKIRVNVNDFRASEKTEAALAAALLEEEGRRGLLPCLMLVPEEQKSARYLPHWVLASLNKAQMTQLMNGLKAADGNISLSNYEIYSSSFRFAEDLVRLATAMGLTALISVTDTAGTDCGEVKGQPIVSTKDGFKVAFSSRCVEAQPKIMIHQEASKVTYSGRLWRFGGELEGREVMIFRKVLVKGVQVWSRGVLAVL